eukprot:248822-Amorphochlora_amoeboformis.AAC.1
MHTYTDNRSKVGGVLPRSAIIPANATYPSPSALLQADIHDPEIKVEKQSDERYLYLLLFLGRGRS